MARLSSSALLFGVLVLICGCVSVPNTRVCVVAGVIPAGMNCAETNTGKTSEMTVDGLVDFLEPQPARPDPAHPDQVLPARGGAACLSAQDYERLKTAVERACRELGSKCKYEGKLSL